MGYAAIEAIIEIATLLAILSYFLFCRVFKIEHDEFHDKWINDGKPHGMPFWFPMDELGELGFRSNPWRKGTYWLFKTPDWVKGHPMGLQIFRYFRYTTYTIIFLSFLIIIIEIA